MDIMIKDTCAAHIATTAIRYSAQIHNSPYILPFFIIYCKNIFEKVRQEVAPRSMHEGIS
jgi:hypothetical protein